MPGKYRVRAQLSLSTEVEPDGHLSGMDDDERVLDYEDMSSWDREPITCGGGDISFEVEAVGEEDARNIADDILDGAHYVGDGYFEWEIGHWEISDIEEIEPPMDLEQALEIIRAYFGTAEGLTDEQRAAFLFVLEHITP
jgi:hypothetical protein